MSTRVLLDSCTKQDGHTLCACECCAAQTVHPKVVQSMGGTRIVSPAHCACSWKCERCYKRKKRISKRVGSGQNNPTFTPTAPSDQPNSQLSQSFKLVWEKSGAGVQELSLITKEKRKRNAPRKVKQQVDTTQDTPSSDEEEEEAVDDHMQEKAQTDMMSRFSMDQSTGHSKRKKVMKPEDNKLNFFTKCTERAMKVQDGLWLLPGLTKTTYLMSDVPVVVCFWAFEWMCTCSHFSHFSQHLGCSCWHIEWCVERLAQDMLVQQETPSKVASPEPPTQATGTVVEQTQAQSVGTAAVQRRSEFTRNLLEEQAAAMEATTHTPGVCTRKLRQRATAVSSGNPAILTITKVVTSAAHSVQQKRATNNYEVHSLVGRRVDPKTNLLEYMVHWKGWDHRFDEWVLVENLHCDELIMDFEKKKNNGQDSLYASLQACGYFAPTLQSVVRYNKTSYFVVPYGMGRSTEFCVVGPDVTKSAMRCVGCTDPSAPQHVSHTKLVVQALKDQQIAGASLELLLPNIGKDPHFKNVNTEVRARQYAAVSRETISIDIAAHIQQKQHDYTWLHNQDYKLKPAALCKCGGTYNLEVKGARLFTLRQVYEVDVYSWTCGECKPASVYTYDGSSDGIFNLNNHVLMMYELFMDYIILCISAKSISFSGYVRKMNLMYKLTYGHAEQFVVKTVWIQCFLGWVALLKPAANLPFTCTLCDKYPAWLCFDGVSLGLPKKNILWGMADLIPNVGAATKDPGRKTNTPLLEAKRSRELLHSFAKGQIAEDGFKELLEDTQAKMPPLHQLLQTLYNEEIAISGNKRRIYTYSFVGIWRQLMLVLSSTDSIIYLLHPAVVCALQRYLTTSAMPHVDRQLLSQLCPVMYNLFAAVNANFATSGAATTFPPKGLPLLKHMVNVCIQANNSLYVNGGMELTTSATPQCVGAQNPRDVDAIRSPVSVHASASNAECPTLISPTAATSTASRPVPTTSPPSLNSPHHNQQAAAMVRRKGWKDSEVSTPVVLAEQPYELSGSAWHAWPKLRELPVYNGIDKGRTTIGGNSQAAQTQWCGDDDEEDTPSITVLPDICAKTEDNTYANKGKVAGIFVSTCVHRICYGFHIMYEPEGRKDLHKVLYERMPQEVLQNLTVVFDFACAAAPYSCRREPELFGRVKWLIDRFHSYSHKCSDFWKMASYPTIAKMCSTASESLNAKVQNFDSACGYMRQETFMTFMTLIFGILNYLKEQETKGGIDQLCME